jgi:polysaccharide export outer membrane protein
MRKLQHRSIYILALLVMILVSSCASRERIVYLQNPSAIDATNSKTYESRLQADDLLSIIVNSASPELTKPYNLFMGTVQDRTDVITAQQRLQSYLIDKDGFIDFPKVGKLKLGGLTRTEAEEVIKQKLIQEITDVSISLRILNFKVSVQGEVARPGVHTIMSERITLLEALSMSGDLTVYGRRDNILIIRENDGKKTYNYVDITKADFVNSDFYYLAQNDLVYVEPNKVRVNSSAVGPNVSVVISAISVLASVVSVIVVISR